MNFKFIYTIILLCTFSVSTFTQETISTTSINDFFTIGEKKSIHSEILNEDRPIIIYTPSEYAENPDKNYPVIYLLDGGSNYLHTVSSANYLAEVGKMPHAILVAIPNTKDRTHDLTPPILKGKKGQWKTAGGADSLLSFISKELMPFVDNNYRTAEYKMLIGHSFGGLFAIHSMINYPEMFNSYIAISPSLWWDEQVLVLDQSKALFDFNNNLKGHLYITMANEGGTMIGGAWKLLAQLEEKSPDQFFFEFEHLPEENHGSIPFLSTYNGLQFIFKEWSTFGKKDDLMSGGVKGIKNFRNKVKNIYGLEAPLDNESLESLGKEYVEDEDWVNAKELYAFMVEEDSKDWRSWAKLGYALDQNQDIPEAINAYRKSVEINTENNILALTQLSKLGEDVSKHFNLASLTEKMANKIIGDYDAPNMLIRASYAEGKLWLTENPDKPNSNLAENTFEIFPFEKHVFYYPKRDAKLTFHFEKGEVIAVYAVADGSEFTIPKSK